MMNKKNISRKEALKRLGGLTIGAPFATLLTTNSVLAAKESFPDVITNQKAHKSPVPLISEPGMSSGVLPADLVNVFIDTVRPRFDYFVSASLPYGMVALSPDTKHGNLWDAGYRYDDKYILNFSHIHNAQTAGIPVMPVTGPCRGNKGLEASKSSFYHEKEIAEPGYHKVFLEDYKIKAELTATCRVGMHRYTFPETDQAHILFDLSAALGPTKMSYAYVHKKKGNEIEGYSIMAPTFRRKKPCMVYFVALFSKPFDDFAGWKDTLMVKPDTDIIRGENIGAYVTYKNLINGEKILMKVAVSFVSISNARLNLVSELPHWNFEEVVANAKEEWNNYLGRIQVEGGTREQRIKFYTDLMHTATRRISSDIDGSYTDNTGPYPVVRKVPTNESGVPERPFMDFDGLWGTKWNLNILWALIYPEYGNWIAETSLDYYRTAGMMSRNSWGGNYSYVMVGDTTTPLLAALISTERNSFDPQAAYKAAYKNAFPGGIRDRAGYEAGPNPQGGGIDWYIKYGYVPVEIAKRGHGFHKDGASMTLEYAYQDWCIAQMAKILGKQDDLNLFLKRSEYWKNTFNSSVGWACPRHLTGEWLKPFLPLSNVGFTEGNSAVYTFYVPQNIQELIEVMGGKKSFLDRLDSGFKEAEPFRFISPFYSGGTNKHGGWVDYSNQPSCEMAHLFSHGGEPWKTQYWVRQVKELTFGGTDPYSGYNGDEDQGQMGALGVLMAIGLFDLQGCVGESPNLEITSPVFDKVVMKFPSIKNPQIMEKFEILISKRNEDDVYIQNAKLNGKKWNNFRFPVKNFFAGGKLEIGLGPDPQKEWGS